MLQQHWLDMLKPQLFQRIHERYDGFGSLQEFENSTQTMVMREVRTLLQTQKATKKVHWNPKAETRLQKWRIFYSTWTKKMNSTASLEERELFTVQHFLNSVSPYQCWLKTLETLRSLAITLQDTVAIVKNPCSVRTPILHNADIQHWIPRQSVKVLGRKPNSMGVFFL